MNKKFYGNVGYLEDTDFSDTSLLESRGNQKSYVVFIFSSGCHFCVEAFPEFDKFATSMAESTEVCVRCIQADGERDSEKRLGGRLRNIIKGFRGFPTIVIFRDGKHIDTHKGDRTESGFRKFVEKV